MRKREVVVVGAGPAGLAIAWHLRRRGLDGLLLERAERVGATFAAQPGWMRMLSPARLTRVPGMAVDRDPYPLMSRYADLLAEHAAREDYEVETGCEVRSVRRSGDGFVLSTSRDEIEAAQVVFATGVFANPHVPDVPGLDRASVPWFHSSELGRHEEPAGARVLIVGGGVSGTELALRLSQRNEVRLAERCPRWRVPRRILGIDLHYLAWPLERMLRPRGRPAREPVFAHWVRALREHRVERVPGVLRIRGNVVALEDGREVRVDHVVFATGYRPALRPLADLGVLRGDGVPEVVGLESPRLPGLFFLGVPGLRTHASGYVRGFGADARWIARRVASRLRRGA